MQLLLTNKNRSEVSEDMKNIPGLRDLSNTTSSKVTDVHPGEQKEPGSPSKVALSDFPTLPASSPTTQISATEPLRQAIMENELPTYEHLYMTNPASPEDDASSSSESDALASADGENQRGGDDVATNTNFSTRTWSLDRSEYGTPTSNRNDDPVPVSQPSDLDDNVSSTREQIDLWLALLSENRRTRRALQEKPDTTVIAPCQPPASPLKEADDFLEIYDESWPQINSVQRFRHRNVWTWSLSLCSPSFFRPCFGIVSFILGWRPSSHIFDQNLTYSLPLSPFKAQLRYVLPSWIFGDAALDLFQWNRMSSMLFSPQLTYFREVDDRNLEIAIRKADVRWIRQQIQNKVLLPGDSVKGIGSPLEASCILFGHLLHSVPSTSNDIFARSSAWIFYIMNKASQWPNFSCKTASVVSKHPNTICASICPALYRFPIPFTNVKARQRSKSPCHDQVGSG